MSRHHRRNALPYRISLVLAPVLMGLAFLIDRSPQADTTEELLALVKDHPDSWLLAGSLFMAAGLAWLVAGIGIARHLGRRSRLLGIGGLAIAASGVGLSLVDAAGIYLPGLATSGASLAQQVSVVEHVESSAPLLAIEIVHVAGWGLGLLVVAIGLLTTGDLPRWVPILLLVSLAGIVAFADGPVLMAAVAAQVVAFVVLASRLTDRAAAASVSDHALTGS